MRRVGLRLTGVALAAASCIPMLAMLPGGVVTVLALLGITTTAAPVAGLGAFLAPIAQSLLILSVGTLVWAICVAAGHLPPWPSVAAYWFIWQCMCSSSQFLLWITRRWRI